MTKCACLLLLLVVSSSTAFQTASVYKTDEGLKIVDGLDPNAVAYATYNDTVNENGWKVLEIAAGYSSQGFVDRDMMSAAGMLEGYLTQKDIFNMFTSLSNESFSGHSLEYIKKVKEFYEDQMRTLARPRCMREGVLHYPFNIPLFDDREWMQEMINSTERSSSFWYYTALILKQFDGMKTGYALAATQAQQLEDFAFDFLSGNGDYLDIAHFVNPGSRPDVSTLSKNEMIDLMNKGHCSALIKILPGYENVYAAHSSWYIYTAMNRIFKHYTFRVHNEYSMPATQRMSFSSYPGYLSSLDDFYIMDSGLVMLQTTNSIYNKTLYDYSTPKALLAWHRVRLANWLAEGGKDWADIVSQYNSGTYNNQYMVLDMKKIELKKAVHDDALWVVEQIPGLVESGDQSNILRAGYWPSYNVPFYETIFQVSGYAAAEQKFGADVSYQLCPRAKIFRRDQANVKDMDTMQYIMRFNDYQNDPYSEGNPMNSICSRGDLKNPPFAGGCYDTKVTDYNMAKSLQSFAQNGPTHQNLPPFRWSSSGLDPMPMHLGQPDVFNFTFVLMEPKIP